MPKTKPKYKDEEWLREQLKDLDRSFKEVANTCNVTLSCIEKWAYQKFDINKNDAQKIVNGKKKCCTCGRWLSLDKFWKAPYRSTGLRSDCKECQRKSHNKRTREREREDKKFKLDRRFSHNLYLSLKRAKNGHHWEDLVPYTCKDLKKHLENQFENNMTWDNYAFDGWHIDHIKPKSHFDYESPEDEEFQECWALDNLQPLWAEENFRKSDKLNWEGSITNG